jgi:hypothetical protein
MKRIITFLSRKYFASVMAAIVCLCSCEKQEKSHWLADTWVGEYDTVMINNDTGEREPHVGVVVLEFSDDRSECVVQGGVKDLYAVTRKTYKAYLNDTEKSFVLNEGDYDSRILYWGELKDNGKLMLNWYNGEELMTVELVAHKVE